MTNCSFQTCHHPHPLTYSPDQLNEIEQLMQPGMLCYTGFLGKDVEEVDDLYITDQLKLEKIGFTHFQLGTALERITILGIPIGHLTIIVHENEDENEMTCPFDLEHTGCHRGRRTFEIKNNITGEVLKASELAIKLLRDHSFIEGKATGYRIEPEQALNVLTSAVIAQLTADLFTEVESTFEFLTA